MKDKDFDCNNIGKKITAIIYVLMSVAYIAWRICFTLYPEQIFASVIFLSVDIVTCVSTILFVISLLKRPIRPAVFNNIEQFSVDVFVPTYNESCEMLELTLRHCIIMDYPHKTYLLDDGNRKEMRLLAERLGVGYLTREKNTGAKAGNLNNAIKFTNGELIAVFDADFRPEKEFLSRLTGYFSDKKVAVVQTPQAYYNTDSFQHLRISRNETYSDQDTFMHVVLPARNKWNAAYWIGTNALLRREAIEMIGGLPTDSVTEDTLTSILIHGKGWQTVYVDEPLAYGLAPVNISEYFVQRLRWAKGAFQILRSHNPLFKKGLTFMQRLFYFSSVIHFFEGGIKVIYFLLPSFFFLFGIIPIYPYPPIIIEIFTYIIIARLMLKVIIGKGINIIIDDIYSVIKSFIYIAAFPAFVFNKNISFAVTPKNKDKSISLKGVTGPAIIFGFNLTAILTILLDPYIMKSNGIAGWIGFSWCLYIGGISFFACYYSLKPLWRKSNEARI